MGRRRRRRDRARTARRPRSERSGARDDALAVLAPPAHARDAAARRRGRAGAAPHRRRRSRAPRARGIRRRRHAPARARPPAVVRRCRRRRASGGSRAISTRRRSADRSPRTTCSGVGGASLTLASLQLPTPARRGLDVGTGCGIQALRARRGVGARGRDRHLPEGARLHAAERPAQRRRRDRDAARQPVRPGRGRGVRPDRVEPAVRDHAAGRGRSGLRVPRRRTGRRRPRRGVRPRGRRAPRSRRRRTAARQLGDPRRRRRTRPRARVGRGVAGAARRLGGRARDPRSARRTPSSGCATAARSPGTPAFARLVDAWLDDFDARR